jgi:hypothetical protein
MPRAAGPPIGRSPFLCDSSLVLERTNTCPPKKRAASTTAANEEVCKGLCVLGRRGHAAFQYIKSKMPIEISAGTARPGLTRTSGPFGSVAMATADALGNDPGGGNYRVSEDAAAGDCRAAAARYGAAHCNYCKVLLRRKRRAASGHGPGTPD